MEEGAFRVTAEGLGVRLGDRSFALFRAYERALRRRLCGWPGRG